MTGWFRRLCAVTIICWIRSTIVFGEEEASVPEWWSNEEVLERIVNTALEASLIPPVSESSSLTELVESAIRPNIGDRGGDFVAGGRESHHGAQQFARRQDNQPSNAGGSQLFPPIIHEGYIKGYERSPLDPRPREPIEGPQGPPKFESHRLQQQHQQQQTQQHQENIRKRQEEQQQHHQENLRLRQEEERRRQQQAQQEKLRQEQKQQEEQRRQQQIQQERFVQQQQKIQEEKLRQQQQELQKQQQVEEERLRYQQQLENEQQQRFQKEQQQIMEEQRRRQQLEQQELQKQTVEQRRQQQQHQNRFQSQHEDNRKNVPVRDFATIDEHHQTADTSRPLINDNFQNQPDHSQKEQVSRNDGTTFVDLNAPRVPSFVPVPNESQEAPSPPALAPVVAPSKDESRDVPKPDKKLETGEDAGFPPFPISVDDLSIHAEEPKKKDRTFVSISDKRDFVAPLSEETFSEETILYSPIDEVTELQREDYVTDSVATSQPPVRVPEKVVIEPLPSSFPTNRPNFATSSEQDIAQVQVPKVETSVIDQEPKQQNVPESKQSEFIIPDNALPPNKFPDIPVPVLPPLQRPESHPPLTFPVFPSVSQIQPPAEVQPVPFIDLSGKFDFPLIQSCSPTLWRDKNVIRGRSLKEIAHLVGAGNFFALTLSVESLLDQIVGNGPYTLFLPSNEALLRLPRILLDSWCRDDALMTSMLRNHVVKARLSLDDLRQTALLDCSSPGGVLHLRNNRNETISVNGQRISVADIDGPGKGIIHVLDGFLYPATNRNILQTLTECRRYDGFLSLLHTAQLIDILRTGGITVFVPSNAALSKLSQEELQYVQRDQSTLREFLLYHIVNGIYFSSDVKEGYYLPTYLDKRAIKVGTRTDGCYRRLQEANNSPFHRTDIPATNGVIHILDWVLKPSDLDSCENLCLP